MKELIEWIEAAERLPEIPADAPDYSKRIYVLIQSKSGSVREAAYGSNAYAKTEKGGAPRWEEKDGRLFFGTVVRWAHMPKGKADGANQNN